MTSRRPRHQITETSDLAHALPVAARRWPQDSRSKLLVRLLHAGGAVLEQQDDEATIRQRAAIDRAGAPGGVAPGLARVIALDASVRAGLGQEMLDEALGRAARERGVPVALKPDAPDPDNSDDPDPHAPVAARS